MKNLGSGLMRLPLRDADDVTSINLDEFKLMADEFISRGFTYFDAAFPYHNEKCEDAFRQAVAERYPRSAYILADKMPVWLVSEEKQLDEIFELQLKRCGVEYFDYYLVHSLNKEYYENAQKFHAFEFVARKKAEGKIRHIGFSFHDDSSLLERIMQDHPESEFVQLQINYLDWNDTTIQARKCYNIATEHKKPIIVMEPVKGGMLANIPEEAKQILQKHSPGCSPASWAIRYAASLPGVFMVLSGMSTIGQVKDNVEYMSEFKPLSEEELSVVASVRDIIHDSIAIPCTACHYCTDGCPMKISIPEYFALYNTVFQFKDKHNSTWYYNVLKQTHGKASDCIECGQCEEHCPQHIKIMENLKLVAKTFE